MRYILVLLTLTCAAPAFAQKMLDFKSDRYGFSLSYPDTYKQMDPQGQHREAIVLSSVADDWTSKTTFDIEVTSAVTDLQKFCKNYESIWAGISAFKDFTIVGQKDTTFQGQPARTYTCTAYVPENQKMIEWRSTIFLHNGQAWKITVSSYPNRMEQTLADMRGIFESLTFK